MAKVCDMDCFNCKFPDCINDYVKPSHYKPVSEQTEEQVRKARDRCKKRYYALKAAGLCAHCGQAPAIDGGTRCLRCRNKLREYDRVRRCGGSLKQKWRAEGKCHLCGGDRVDGQLLCAYHLERARVAAEKCHKHPNTIKANRERFKKIFWRG